MEYSEFRFVSFGARKRHPANKIYWSSEHFFAKVRLDALPTQNANLLVLIDWKVHALPNQPHEPANFSTMLPWCLTQTCTNKAKHALLCNASSTSPTGNHEAHIASANLKKGISTNKCEVISYKLGSLMLGSLADPPPWPDKKYILRTLESPYISHFSYTPLLGVKMGKSLWKSPGFFLSAKPSFDRWPVLAKGDLCWYPTGFCTQIIVIWSYLYIYPLRCHTYLRYTHNLLMQCNTSSGWNSTCVFVSLFVPKTL